MIRSEKLTGVVLKRTPIGEADLLVTWFTAELGKIRTVAKSALRTKSRLAYGLSPFSETEVRIAGKLENVSLKLIGAIPKRVILTNPGELEMVLSSWVFELILKGSPDHERNQHLYEVLIQSLEVLGGEKFTSEFADAWRVFFTERIMKSLGWSIQPFLKNGRSGFDQTYGTGVVHNAAMYGEEDFLAAKNRGLPRVDMLDQKGEYLDIAPEFLRGKFFKDADSLVLQDLSQRGLVYKLLPFMHSYPHCYRCATPLFYNALPAWFINIQKLKPELLAQNQQVNWYPEHLKTGRFANSVEGAPDWNISRNRFWATALPFWKCQDKNCGQVTCVGSVAELKSKAQNFSEVYPQVADINFPLPVASESVVSFSEDEAYEKLDLHKPYIDMVVLTCEKCEKPMQRVPEVVDCWVESGSMPFAELHAPFENEREFKARFPADFVSEYIAQTRAWFYVMHVVGVGVFGRAPFRNVVTTGNILAEDGSKMSKSLKNYPDPWLVIEKYGIDALRFYLLSTPVMNGDDLNFSEKGLKDVYQKLNMLLFNVWQFYRMYESKSSGADFSEIPKVKQVLDVWILERVKQLTSEVTKAMDSYQTPKACRALLDFISDLSTWYVRRSRDRMKTEGSVATDAVNTLGYVLTRVSILLAPLAPFLSENIFRSITGGESVHLVKWPHEEGRESTVVADEKVLSQMAVVREICSMALAVRKKAGVSVRQPLQALGFELKDQNIRLSVDHFDVILEELNVKEIKDVESLSELSQRRGLMEEVEGQGVVTKILLDLELNEALIREGHTRELERAVQDLRKKAGLKPGDEVTLYYNTQDEQLESLLLEQLDRKKTSVKEIAKEVEVEADEEVQSEVGGKAVWLGILKA